jgi:hypothetical protein
MEIAHALVKDLRSTGYFFDELKDYKSPDMDITTYCINFVIPYLVRVSESYESSGHSDRSRILRLAIEHLSNPSDGEAVDFIFGLRTVAVSEIAKAHKEETILQQEFDKSRSLTNRHKLESAEFLTKLLVNIIKMFRLVDPHAKQKKADEIPNPVGDAVMERWETLELTGL